MSLTYGVVGGLASIIASTALGQNDYEFSTDSGEVRRNGVLVTNFEGSPVSATPVADGLRTWIIRGDMRVPANFVVRFKGDNLARVLVGGNLVVPSNARISADAEQDKGGPGGGDGGDGGTGGNGGAGGFGFGAASNGTPTAGDPGQNAMGAMPGLGGQVPRAAPSGSEGNNLFGTSGGTGQSSGIGENGAAGLAGTHGQVGGVGLNNGTAAATGGLPTGSASGGTGGSAVAGGGAGGAPNGGSASAGENGNPGSDGFDGTQASGGANGGPFFPNDPLILNGGNAGGGGGLGGTGGSGGDGSKGGGGGGGVQFIVQGRVDCAGSMTALGGIGPGSADGSNGQPGGAGAAGGAGGLGGLPSGCSGVPGGDGAAGGTGGLGGRGGKGGRGGDPSVGAGGCVFLAATYIEPIGSIDVGGGGFAGRVLYGDAGVWIRELSHTTPPTNVTHATDFVPSSVNPYFTPGFITPNIVEAVAGGVALNGGAAPFGMLSNAATDPALAAAIAAAPAGTGAIVMRYDGGPAQLDLKYNLSFAIGAADDYDMYLVYNATGGAASVVLNGVPIARYPYSQRPEFGGDGTRLPSALASSSAFVTLGPESFSESLNIDFRGVSTSVSLPTPPVDGASVAYIAAPCAGDLDGDGMVGGSDLGILLGAWGSVVAPGSGADLNGDGVVDALDLAVLLARFGGAC